MTKPKSPYNFPHRSRAAITEYLVCHQSYHPMNGWNGGFVLAWNIKVSFNFDTSGKHGEPVQDRFDEAWDKYVEHHDSMFWDCCNDALRYYTDGEWSNYPGIEQGEWKFGVNGRSGGYLVLTDAPSWVPAPRAWRLFPMIWESRSAFSDWLDSLSWEMLRRFYRAISVLDHDLSRENIAKEMAYQYSWQRVRWEEDQIAAEDCTNAKIEASRPDMKEGFRP